MSQYSNPPQATPPAVPPVVQLGAGLAITAFVVSVLGMCVPLVGFVAIVLGIIAVVGAAGPTPKRRGMGFGIAAICIGGVSIVFSLVTIGMMLPALGQARQAARQLKSQSQLRGIAQAMMVYSQASDDTLPPYKGWDSMLVWHGLVPIEMLVSPAAPSSVSLPASFNYAGNGPPPGPVVTPPSYFYVPASSWSWNNTQVLLYEHPGHFIDGVHVAFHDGHVEFMPHAKFNTLIASLTLEDGTLWAPHEAFPIEGP